MTYEVIVTNVPDGAYSEHYISSKNNNEDRNPNKGECEFATREQAETVVREFYEAKSKRPDNFEPDMDAEVVEKPWG